MRSLKEALRATILDRASAFTSQIEQEQASIGSSGPGIPYVLDLFLHYVDAFERHVNTTWSNATDEDVLLDELRWLMAHLLTRVDLFDDRFSRGHRRVPRSLSAAIEAECAHFGLDQREAVLTIGPPGNYVTFVADLKSYIFRDIGKPLLPTYLEQLNPVMIAVPYLEGTRSSWQPVVVGHELAHYLQRNRPVAHKIRLTEALTSAGPVTFKDLPPSLGPTPTIERALLQIAVRWLNELICDAYAVHRFGPAGFVSLVEFLESVAATNDSGPTHPPGRLRAFLMLKWLGDDLSNIEKSIVLPFVSLGSLPTSPDWVAYLAGVFADLSYEISTAVESWSPSPSYRSRQRSTIVSALATQLESGIPGSERVVLSGELSQVEPPDVINACWLAMVRETDKPVDRLTAKALDTLDFVRKWTEAGGSLDDPEVGAPTNESLDTRNESELHVLGESELRNRLDSSGPDVLIMTPRLPHAVRGASVDVRLGNQFIIFQQSAAPSFDALEETHDPRSMQLFVEKAWGDTFYLHPGQLVLAATLEYLVVPSDLTAQVVTRSSYGRLGLLSATAVQVHPSYAGCLTLELVNLGEMPLTVTPGERIAQLVFMRTSETLSSEGKYQYPTGPEFSRIRRDSEGTILYQIRRSFIERRSRLRPH